MYRDRLSNTNAKSPAAKRLQNLMLEQHDFQKATLNSDQVAAIAKLAQWQTIRLQTSHRDLYNHQDYRAGLDFLLTELYNGQDVSARDRDLERIFPKLLKLLPEKLIDTVANLIELNLLTLKLDRNLSDHLIATQSVDQITQDIYIEAYLVTSSKTDRLRQLQLVQTAGSLLDRHAKNPLLRFSLIASEKPAARAGLDSLHSFLKRGFDAFYAMDNVDVLIRTLIERESQILSNIFNKHADPFLLKP